MTFEISKEHWFVWLKAQPKREVESPDEKNVMLPCRFGRSDFNMPSISNIERCKKIYGGTVNYFPESESPSWVINFAKEESLIENAG